jgi:hypothetical protein
MGTEHIKTSEMDCGPKISNALKSESFYTYKTDISRRWGGGGAGFLSNEEIKAHARAGHFKDQDYYMLQTLNEMRFATAADVLARVRFLCRTGTNRRFVPILTVDDMDRYLRLLAKRGVVYYYMYKRVPAAVAERIFFITKEGFLLFSTELMLRGAYYDEKSSYKPPFEVFKYLAANRVMSAFIQSKKCVESDYVVLQEFKEGNHTFKNKFFGTAVLEDERFRHTYVFEPIRFQTPLDKLTFEDNYERVKYRIDMLKKMIHGYTTNFQDNELLFVVFIVEDIKGMRSLLNILKEDYEHNFWENTALITSDYAVCESFQGDFYNALYGIKYVGVNIAVSQKRPYIDMGLPSAWRQLSGEE